MKDDSLPSPKGGNSLAALCRDGRGVLDVGRLAQIVELSAALHRLADAAIDADVALHEVGAGERTAEAVAVLQRNADQVRLLYVALGRARDCALNGVNG